MSPLRRIVLPAALLWVALALLTTGASAQQLADELPAQSAPADSMQTLPLRRDNGSLTPQVLMRVGAVLLLGAVLVLLAVFVVRRFLLQPASGAGRRIRVIEARRATPQLTLVLVRLDDRELLVAQSGDGVALLQATDAQALPNE